MVKQAALAVVTIVACKVPWKEYGKYFGKVPFDALRLVLFLGGPALYRNFSFSLPHFTVRKR